MKVATCYKADYELFSIRKKKRFFRLVQTIKLEERAKLKILFTRFSEVDCLLKRGRKAVTNWLTSHTNQES